MNDELSNVRMAEFAECVRTSVIFNQASAPVCHFTTASEPFGWIEGLMYTSPTTKSPITHLQGKAHTKISHYITNYIQSLLLLTNKHFPHSFFKCLLNILMKN